jgi:hypothetical protein
VVVAVVGHQGPTQPPDAEPGAQAVDESEALACGSVMDQRLRGLAQDLDLHTQTPDLTPLLTQFDTQASDDRCQVAVIVRTGRHEQGLCRSDPSEPHGVAEPWPEIHCRFDESSPEDTQRHQQGSKVVLKTVSTPANPTTNRYTQISRMYQPDLSGPGFRQEQRVSVFTRLARCWRL